ncbi:concanavalin A-like lectin/glucanase domain-containing protein [Chytriomyces sp. MP71]|nr:concanavalin A-like lectin/glucanase domain-containing protein [Chytriomyces sp. MP71]
MELVSLLLATLATGAALVAAQTGCGYQNGNSSCGSSAPCCSEFGSCGASPLHCGGFCQSQYSAQVGGVSPCYGSRFKKPCVSGFYNFDQNTWVINADAYNGDINTADFVVDPLGLDNGNARFGVNGGLLASLTAQPQGWSLQTPNDPNSWPAGLGVRLSSTSWLLYGSYSARMVTSGTIGIVTAFIAFSEERDEIDWEITGRDSSEVDPNYFYRGLPSLFSGGDGKKVNTGIDTSKQFTDFGVVWTKDYISWTINGKEVTNLQRSQTCDSSGNNCQFPSTPSKIQFALWDGSAGAKGTREWVGGYVPWSSSSFSTGFNATIKSITLQCDGDALPTGPPPRAAGYGAPSLVEPVISVTVPGMPGYDATLMSRKKSVYAK